MHKHTLIDMTYQVLQVHHKCWVFDLDLEALLWDYGRLKT